MAALTQLDEQGAAVLAAERKVRDVPKQAFDELKAFVKPPPAIAELAQAANAEEQT